MHYLNLTGMTSLNSLKISSLLAFFGLFGLVSLTQAQSIYQLKVNGFAINAAAGETALPNYLLRFGFFHNGFAPTPSNFASWNSNFTGVTSTFSNPQTLGNTFLAQFTASDNSLYTLGSQVYMVIYNVAPTAPIASATKGVILTRTGWTIGEAVNTDTRRNRWQNYRYDTSGLTLYTGNIDEDNVLPTTDPENFSSPVNILAGVPLSGTLAGRYTVTTSFEMVPEPSSASLVLVGLAGVWAARRRK